MFKYCFILLIALSYAFTAPAATSSNNLIPIIDEHGREFIPGGFVLITEDSKGPVTYTPDDYQRMIQIGANVQVIRITLGRLGGWPGKKCDPDYLKQIDAMVQMGANAGLKTIFKMVIYDLRPFGREKWQAIYTNSNGAQDSLRSAWKLIWLRYKDTPSVYGYDLLNEPQRGFIQDPARCTKEQLLPTLRYLTDEMHKISPQKWALFQPLYKENGTGEGPFQEITESFGRDRVIYAPHLYSMESKRMARMLNKYIREAKRSKAPLLLGEWGPATDLDADQDKKKQAQYTAIYETTANTIDQHRIGAIKAWFCGTRVPLSTKNRPLFTWAIFSDTSPTGHIERKFITDTIARPRPLAVAGQISNFHFDFKSKTFKLNLIPDQTIENTTLFVPASRFYPNGFQVELGQDIILGLNQNQLHPIKVNTPSGHAQAEMVQWDNKLQRIIIKKWISPPSNITIKITPMKHD